MFQDLSQAGLNYEILNSIWLCINVFLIAITLWLIKHRRVLNCWSWAIFIIYGINMIVKTKAILLLTEYVQHGGDCLFITTEETMHPVCTAFGIKYEIMLLALALIYYIFMLGLVIKIFYSAGRHRSILAETEKYRVFEIVDPFDDVNP